MTTQPIWALSDLPEPHAPSDPRFAELITLEPPTSAVAALRLARDIRLERYEGCRGPLTDVHDRLADLMSQDPDDADERRMDGGYHNLLLDQLWHQGSIYEGTAFAILPLVGILVDPSTLDRERLAGALSLIGDSAGKESRDAEVAPGVRWALERCLPVLLRPPPLNDASLAAWRTLLLVIAMFDGKAAAWIHRLAEQDDALAERVARLENGGMIFELIEENESL